MKQKWRTLIPLLLFAVGLGVLFYPVFSDLWNQHRQNALMADYDAATAQLSQADYTRWKTAAQAYNQSLTPTFYDAFTGEDPAKDDPYWQLLNIDGSGMMGYIEIPKIDVRLPIYHGISESVLEHGIGHLAGSSLPVGGAGTHCVLSGHRGLPTALLLTDLDQLEVGDRFGLHVLGEELVYEVDQIQVVEPTEVSALKCDPEGDYVTLVTCTPYGVNSHRLLVRGCRTDQPLEDTVTPLKQMLHSFGWKGKLLIALLAIFLAFGIFRRMQKAAQKREQNQKKGGETL